MTVKELKTYLDKYTDIDAVSFIAVNPKNRIMWPDSQINIICATDAPVPVIGFELHDSKPMDEEMIRAAEADEQNSKWTSVAEKLPKPGKRYLTTMKYRESDVVGVYDAVYGSNGFWHGENYEPISERLTVIAWMPLPEPYQEEDEPAERKEHYRERFGKVE